MSIRQSPFIQDAKSGKRITRWWLAILLFLVTFVISIGVVLGLDAFWQVRAGSAAAQVQEVVISLVTILLVFAWVVWFERRRIATLGFHRPQRGVLTLLLGIVIGLAMISVPILLLWATGAYQVAAPPPDSSSGFSALPLVLVLAMTFMIQSSMEEILSRGFLFQSLGLQLSGWLAVVIPALLFTVVHGVVNKPIPFITIFFFGLFMTFVALERKSLWLNCGIHAGWNWALGNIFGLSVSGAPPKSNALFFLEPTPGQPDWLTGGTFGTEGSLIASFMIITATVVVFVAWWRGDRTQPSSPAPQQTPAGATETGV